MFDKRELQQRSRRALHTALKVDALYYPLERDASTEGVPITVRVHHRTQSFGDMTGFDYDPAERIETVPEIVFLREQVTPSRGAVVSIAEDEAYQVGVVFPPKGITIKAQVSRWSQAQIDSDVISYPGAV